MRYATWAAILAPFACAQTADLLIYNARVATMNSRQPAAEAFAIRGERIVWLGTNEQAKSVKAADRRDLHGATVLPGINDSHTHLLPLGESFLRVNLKDLATEDEMVAKIRERAQTAAPGEWILGWGWDEGAWAAHYPTHEKLSVAVPDHPVVLSGLHSFASWVNRKALEAAGITRSTKDPENGKIIRDAAGEPTGVLTNTAQRLVAAHVPPLSPLKMREAIALAGEECARYGLTSVQEARVSQAELDAIRELIAERRLKLRVSIMLDGADDALVATWLKGGPEIDKRSHRLNVRSFKLFADGALGSRGASLFEPYSDAPQTKGVMTTPAAKIENLTRRALERGFQVATHAIGDAANHATLDAYEKALRAVPEAHDARLRIEHAQVLAPGDIPRFVKLGVIASMQAPHATSDMPWAEQRLGPKRILGAYAWRSVLKTGAHVPLSSDFPGETLDPFRGMYAAITRQDAAGNPPGGWYPAQRLTLEEALRAYTVEAAYAEFEERDKGSIAPGMLADFVVLSKEIRGAAPQELLSVPVTQTWIGGKKVNEVH
jgi:predicted amidohydrolase YtcJ